LSSGAPSLTRISALFLTLIVIVLVISVVALYQSVAAYQSRRVVESINFMVIGLSGLALSTYIILQTRRRMMKITLTKEAKVVVTLTCPKCGFKSIRDFQKGDFVFKRVDPCPKCSEAMLITAIYREVSQEG